MANPLHSTGAKGCGCPESGVATTAHLRLIL